MQEDLEHIALIDSYLTGTLSPSEKDRVEKLLLNDPSFAKEVTVYKKIYEGIQQKEEADLKKRLVMYHKTYEEDLKTAADQRPKGKYRSLLTYGGAIAACLIIGAGILLFNTYEERMVDPRPDVVDVDTNLVKETDTILDLNKEKLADKQKENKPRIKQAQEDHLVSQDSIESVPEKDSLVLPNPINLEDTQLAFGGYKTLPSKSIRKYDYSKTLSYTFAQGVFKLYGDPLLSRLDLLSLQIVKNKKTEYFLNFRKTRYIIHKTEQKTPLIEFKEKSITSALFKKSPKLRTTKEEISIDVAAVQNTATILSDLLVRFKSAEGGAKTYFFNLNKENLELIINADIDQEEAKVYSIQEDRKEYFYLVQENEIYALDKNAKEPTPLTSVDITTNKLARLFIKKEPITKVVLKEK